MKNVSYTDIVFGSHVITEPVIVDIINSASLQRLQDIDQTGYPEPFFPGLKKLTRFEHSLGVYLLLYRYGASVEEQVAGLIHDVSHTAFSHCADYSLADAEGGKTQSHQDNIFEEYVRQSEIPGILVRHGLQVDTILDDTRFPSKRNSSQIYVQTESTIHSVPLWPPARELRKKYRSSSTNSPQMEQHGSSKTSSLPGTMLSCSHT